ncbi:hypothetical protein [Nocardiopsis sp. NRRL B-16309]|uniref:hypothetical protein n=1 Tax=Nocardiopsis sp. NRRL B-16309 TaxID=1519494 RepID=UPI0006AEADB3|nr:hypothetical protein [Nocardiopsis sp. NRRL B-16309]KOX19651.1 hypothetical protein ADL05_05860 [Nocardiopsis sp. NRRL B-16309]
MDITSRICVSPPYRAVHSISSPTPGCATASFLPEFPSASEGPVSIIEAARHLPIMGLCAAATTAGPGRRYYLARKARLRRLTPPAPGTPSRELHVTALGGLSRPDSASAAAFLYDSEHTTLFDLHCDYVVIDEESFARTFEHLADPTSAQSVSSPYGSPLRLDDVSVSGATAQAAVNLRAEQCAGHFAGFPAVPLAYLLTALVDLSERLLEDPEDTGPPFRVELLQARTLLAPGTPIVLRARRQSDHRVLVSAGHGGDDTVVVSVAFRHGTA